MDAMAGYDRAVIIDSMVTGVERPGTLLRLSLSDLVTTRNTLSVHDMDLPTASRWGGCWVCPFPLRLSSGGLRQKTWKTLVRNLQQRLRHQSSTMRSRRRFEFFCTAGSILMKIGIYFCKCGTNITDRVDADKVKENISVSSGEIHFKAVDFLCSEESKGFLEQDIRKTV